MKAKTSANCRKIAAVAMGALMAASIGTMSCREVIANAAEKAYHGTKYTSTATSAKEAVAQAQETNSKIAEEGITLLKNRANTLPLAKNVKISVFGKNSDPEQSVYGGTGSAGGASGADSVTLYDSLEDAGYKLNPELKKFYADANRSGAGRGANPSMSQECTGHPTGETPVSAYDSKLKESFDEYNGAAIVMFSRVGGEGFDLPRESKNIAGRSDETEHYLELDDNEEDLLKMVTEKFSNVIVIINSAATMELGDLEKNDKIGAVLWVAPPGTSGFQPVGKVINGDINPSGHTVDTWAADFTADPTWQNFAKNNANSSKLNEDGSVKAEYKDEKGNTVTNQYYDESGTAVSKKFQISYEEGIYVGYKYWETRGYTENQKEGATKDEWYDEHVVYPLGYGLSYTSFSQEIVGMKLGEEAPSSGSKISTGDLDKVVKFSVKVTNTGNVAGKHVVQLYYNAPYYDGGIEKAYVNLADFAKTKTLAAGESETVEVSVKIRDLASYDWNDANNNGYSTYELDAGTYSFFVGENAHVWSDKAADLTLEVGGKTSNYTNATCGKDAVIASIVTEGDEDMYEGKTSTNQYNDVNAYFVEEGETIGDYDGMGYGTILSRSDWDGTWPAPPTYAELKKDQDYLDELAYPVPTANAGEVSDYDKGAVWEKTKADLDATLTVGGKTYKAYSETQKTAADNVMTLAEFAETITTDGKLSYDIKDWAPFLEQLTLEQMAELMRDGGFKITMPGMDVFGLDNVKVGDGGTGFTTTDITEFARGCNYVSSCMLAATWNIELAKEEGTALGTEAIWLDMQGLYGIGTNIHRSPFSGRNFEYYSEDAILAGKLAAKVTEGAQEKGLILFNKHFFLNDTEQDRDQTGILTWATEQTMRENYMKVEEIITRQAHGMGVMTAFNRIGKTWVGESYATLTNVLRGEWGFEGVVITDGQNGWMKNARMIRAGNDMALAMLGKIDLDVSSEWAKTDPTHLYYLRQAAKNILYAIARSNVMNRSVKYAETVDTSVGYYMPGDEVTSDNLSVASAVMNQAAVDGKLDAFTYELVGGALPEGLSLEADGKIVGTISASAPEKVYYFNVALKTSDGEYIGQQVAEFKITIGDLNRVDNYVGYAQCGEMFEMYVQAGKGGEGNNPVLDYALAEDSELPAGLSLTSNGTIKGIPTTAGRFTATIVASVPGTNESVSYEVTVYINDYKGTVSYNSINLPEATVGEYYCVSVGNATTADGTGVTYSISSGYELAITEDGWKVNLINYLPRGLSISPNGMIYGIPQATTEGTPIEITASAAGYQSATATFNFVVKEASSASDLSSEIKAINEKLAALETKVAAAETSSETLKAEIASLKEAISKLPADKTSDIDALKDRVSALETKVNAQQSDSANGGCGSVLDASSVALVAIPVALAAAVILAKRKQK